MADADVVGALAKSYLLSGEGVERGGFEGGEGGRGGGREEWVRNAVKSMEISCILMHLHEDSTIHINQGRASG